MAFKDYISYIKPGIMVIVKFIKNLAEKKADDGKVDFAEFLECVGQLFEDVMNVFGDLIRGDDE